MFCRKCGKDIGDARFCKYCGAEANPVAAEDNRDEKTNSIYETDRAGGAEVFGDGPRGGVSGRKKRVIGLIAGGVVVAAAAALLLFAHFRPGTSADEEWQEQYDLGVKYLEEGDYDMAALAFETALVIDPKSEDSAEGLAEVLDAMGEEDAAAEIRDIKGDPNDLALLAGSIAESRQTGADTDSKSDSSTIVQTFNIYLPIYEQHKQTNTTPVPTPTPTPEAKRDDPAEPTPVETETAIPEEDDPVPDGSSNGTAEPDPDETAEPDPGETAEPDPDETAEPDPDETDEPDPGETAEPDPDETAEPDDENLSEVEKFLRDQERKKGINEPEPTATPQPVPLGDEEDDIIPDGETDPDEPVAPDPDEPEPEEPEPEDPDPGEVAVTGDVLLAGCVKTYGSGDREETEFTYQDGLLVKQVSQYFDSSGTAGTEQTMKYEYDSADRLVSVSFMGREIRSYTYSDGKLVRRMESEGSADIREYTYDGGRIIRETEECDVWGVVVYTYEYNAKGLVSQITGDNSAFCDALTDEADQSACMPVSIVIKYAYDDDGRVLRERTAIDDRETLVEYAYRQAGVYELVTQSVTYSDASSAGFLDLTDTDAMGHTTLSMRLPSNAKLDFDAGGNLISATGSDYSMTFTYRQA